MESPMANWFSSVPHAFDALAYATRVCTRQQCTPPTPTHERITAVPNRVSRFAGAALQAEMCTATNAFRSYEDSIAGKQGAEKVRWMVEMYASLTFYSASTLLRTVEALEVENQRLQGYLEEPSDAPNPNGKRRMLNSHR